MVIALIFLEVIKLAKENDIHLLCLPAHTTHLLQPLDVGVFRSLKGNFSKMCKQFLAVNPGQVITTDLLASLLAKVWPLSVTPVNVIVASRNAGWRDLRLSTSTLQSSGPLKK